MAREIKNKYIGARVDPTFAAIITEYLDKSNKIMGEMIRSAIKEYIEAHPLGVTNANQTTQTTIV